MVKNLKFKNLQLKYTKHLFWYLRIEIDMCKEITGLEMGTAGIIPGKWLKHGQKRNSGILRG